MKGSRQPNHKKQINSPPLQLQLQHDNSDNKYLQLKEQISNEKIKAMMAARLLKKSTSQSFLPNLAGINKSTQNKTKVEEDVEKIRIKTKCLSKQDTKGKKQMPPQILNLPVETKKYQTGSMSSKNQKNKPNNDSERIKIYNQLLLPYYEGNQPDQLSNKPNLNMDPFKNRDKTFTESISTNASNKSKNKISIDDFKLGRILGTGKFGQVFMAQHIKTGFLCAIKRIKKTGLDQTLKNQLLREIKIQTFLNHPNIVKLYTFFTDQQCIYLILQLCVSGQLYTFLRKQKNINQQLAKVVIRQISQGLQYIHQNQIIHRDLKPENILFQNGLMKICDFGWSIDTHLMRQTFCGTPLYVSPELLKKKYYDNKVDVWGLGVLSYELLLGKVPFQIFNQSDFNKIINEDIKFSHYINISTQAKDFIEKCLKKQPEQRMSSTDLLMHPFLKHVQIANFSQIF